MIHYRKKAVSILLIFSLLVGIVGIVNVDTIYAATKNIKTTTYRNTLKSGEMVYCSNAHRVFKVDLKNNEVKILATNKVGYITNMKLKNGYLYYMETSQYGGGCRIYRINLKTGKKTTLVKNTGPQFAIKGKKIYYNHAKETADGIKYKRCVMKINGKSKKSTKYKVKMTAKLTNANGYVVDADMEDYDWSEYYYVDYYLHTPDGDIFLESYYPVV